MKKVVVLLLVLSIGALGCSSFDKRPCPPITICPPAPVPTPCPEPTPTTCPECPPQKECPPEKICPPVVVCPPEKVCPPVPVPTPCPTCPPSTVVSPIFSTDVQNVASSAIILWDNDPKCPPETDLTGIPTRETATCVQREASKAVLSIVKAQEITPNKKSPCWEYAPNNPLNYYTVNREEKYEACLQKNFASFPGVGYGRSAHYLKGRREAVPWEGCATGVSGNPIRVSLVNKTNVLPLVAWETANYDFWIIMDRMDLTDGKLVGQATNRAMAACNATGKVSTVFTLDELKPIK